jgi:micrococcal nuclease
VERVIDGDTFVYTDPHAVKVRLIGIDAPEMRGKEGVQPFAQKATAWLRAQIDQKEVCLELDVDSHDRYERLLAYVYLKDGTFINRQSIEQGYARVLRIKPNTKYATSFQAWQKTAVQQQRGIWQTK